jgi:UPF0755 protein
MAKKKSKTSRGKRVSAGSGFNLSLKQIYVAGAVVAFIIIAAVTLGRYSIARYGGEQQWVKIPADSSAQAVADSLKSRLGDDYGSRVYHVWRLMGGDPQKAHGAYLIEPSTAVWRLARNLKNQAQTPVTVTFNNLRLMPELAERVSAKMEWDAKAFATACDTILPLHGFSSEQYPAAFIPDTYEFYWSASPGSVVKKLLDYRDSFWNDQRLARAKELGLSAIDVATIASIAEEESYRTDERGKIGRLYINRLRRGMKLQADPTVKFAMGDFSIKRVKGEHLAVKSPYNTYANKGLPPGPIRIADKATIDAVLGSQPHPYIYMCAREDFSGYHNFATDFATHQANARRYQAELNKRSIN